MCGAAEAISIFRHIGRGLVHLGGRDRDEVDCCACGAFCCLKCVPSGRRGFGKAKKARIDGLYGCAASDTGRKCLHRQNERGCPQGSSLCAFCNVRRDGCILLPGRQQANVWLQVYPSQTSGRSREARIRRVTCETIGSDHPPTGFRSGNACSGDSRNSVYLLVLWIVFPESAGFGRWT